MALKLRGDTIIDEAGKTLLELTNQVTNMMKGFYPVGSIYTSTSSTNPKNVLGFGTWEQIKGRFLYCSDTSKTTGGSATHTHTTQGHVLSGDEIPAHNHSGIYWYGAYPLAVDGGGENTNRMQLYTDGNASTAAQLKTGTTGGGKAHYHGDTGSSSSLPPYFTIYCWHRTA